MIRVADKIDLRQQITGERLQRASKIVDDLSQQVWFAFYFTADLAARPDVMDTLEEFIEQCEKNRKGKV